MRADWNENHNINSHYCRRLESLFFASSSFTSPRSTTIRWQLNLRFYCAAAYRQCQFPQLDIYASKLRKLVRNWDWIFSRVFFFRVEAFGWVFILVISTPLEIIIRSRLFSFAKLLHWPNRQRHWRTKIVSRSWKMQRRVIDEAIMNLRRSLFRL